MNESEWNHLEVRPQLESVRVMDVGLKVGDRVRPRPANNADIMDTALAGKVAIIESIEQDYEDTGTDSPRGLNPHEAAFA